MSTPDWNIPYVPENVRDPAAGVNLGFQAIDTALTEVQDGADTASADRYTKAEADALLLGKVDKVSGKQLSTEDYSTTEKGKLAGIATAATTNATNAELRDRATHTGVQAQNTVTGLSAALDAKVDNTDARLSDAREWTATEITQVEAEAGTSTIARKFTALRVRQAIVAWWNGFTSAFGRDFVTRADAAAGRSALGLGTFATESYAAAPFVNIMPDSGRFAGRVNPVALSVGAFQSSPFLPGVNGGTHASGGKFNHNNGGTLSEDISSLLTAMGRTGASARAFGAEFHIDEYTCGSGTASASTGTDGIVRHLAVADTTGRVMFQASGICTFVTWLRIKEGSAHARASGQIINGVPVPTRTAITPADGWVHFRCVQTSDIGYDTMNPGLSGLSGTKIQLACSGFFGGFVDPGIHSAPLPTINELIA